MCYSRVQLLSWHACRNTGNKNTGNIWHVLKRKTRQRRPSTVEHCVAVPTLQGLASSVPRCLRGVKRRRDARWTWTNGFKWITAIHYKMTLDFIQMVLNIHFYVLPRIKYVYEICKSLFYGSLLFSLQENMLFLMDHPAQKQHLQFTYQHF